MPKKFKLLVVSSTYPSHAQEKVPAFVKDQIIAFAKMYDYLEIQILAPHNTESIKFKYPKKQSNITEYRFHYFIPFLEKLTDKGIMPALSVSKLNYLVIPFLIIGEFIALFVRTIAFKPDLIYAHWFTPQAINASVVSKLTGSPYVFTTHSSDVDVWKRFGVIGKYVVNIFTRNAKAVTAVSTQTAEKLRYFYQKEKINTLENKLAVIPMGIHFDDSTVVNKEKDSILFIGRITEKKGLKYVFQAIKSLKKAYPDIKLTIAGDGELKEKLEKMTIDLDIKDHVEFCGFVTGNQKKRLLARSEIMLVPSIITNSGDSEGLPVSLMEGLSSSMICIATDVSGASDVITSEKSGFIIRQQEPNEIANAIKKVFSMTEKEKKAIMNEARGAAKDLDWLNIAKKHMSFFEGKI